MGSFWGSLKNALVHYGKFTTRDEENTALQEYIEIFYNSQLRQSQLGFLSPVTFAQQFTKQT
ncbi:MAG: IS3 family transposase [Magnetococcales bacterium]|nr:IS3 family transposase [Magnetococcales bacterium]